jgi:5-methylthioadenosine/S-adenosylhomocysteine deaminase
MPSRQSCDLFIDNIGWLITVDSTRRIITDAAIAVVGTDIVAVGKREEVAGAWQGLATIDARGGVVTPGFIDAHLHSSFQLSRGLADEANAREFLVQRMYPYEAALTPDDVMLSSRLAAREMLRHGTTCFVDPGNAHPVRSAEGIAPLGIRAVLARSAFDLGGSDFGKVPDELVASPDEAVMKADALWRELHGTEDGRISVSVSFRGLNNSSDALIQGLGELAKERETFLQTHACFSYQTHDASVSKFGMPEIERLSSLGVLGPNMLLVHGGWLEPHELGLIRNTDSRVVVNPSSSFHNGYGAIAFGHAPELLADGVTVALGSDHASSGPVDLVREMFLAACGYKEVRLNPRVLPPETAVEMATINGATAIGMADIIGSIEVGKRADIVIFDVDQPEWQPLYNPVSNLVYSATGSTVDTVIVDGRVVVSDKELTAPEAHNLSGQIAAHHSDFARRLNADRLSQLTWPVV